jgi:DUF4097 and DUF4098 domain-containing protein YvlB
MTRHLLFIPLLIASATLACAEVLRSLEKSFAVHPGTTVEVDLPTGSIEVIVSDTDEVEFLLFQTFKTNRESEADELLSQFEIRTEQDVDTVRLIVRREENNSFFGFWKRWSNQVKFKAQVTVPARVNLNLDTAGGQISVKGDIDGDVLADTAGGSIKIDGVTGNANLDTAGGSISAGAVYGGIYADTAGGGIAIDYVGPDAKRVYSDTAGGGITIGLDARGRYSVEADTSGGGVSVEHPGWVAETTKRSYARGEINGGGTEVHADTSGGSIRIRVANPEAD